MKGVVNWKYSALHSDSLYLHVCAILTQLPQQIRFAPCWDTRKLCNTTYTNRIITLFYAFRNSSGSPRRNNDGDALDLHETTTQWRRDQAKQSKNMIRDFVCRTKTYPTIELTCTNYSK